MAGTQKLTPKTFILDVDGVLTDGSYYYTTEGKVMKKFGPDDHDALLLLKPYLHICMITGDKKGFAITQKRVAEDMGFPLHLVSTFERVKWMNDNGFDPKETIYMGDGIFDVMVFDKVAYSIAPANSFYMTKANADFATESRGGDSAVAEACLHIMEKFFKPLNIKSITLQKGQGEWGK